MGLFDRLFGKKGKKEQERQESHIVTDEHVDISQLPEQKEQDESYLDDQLGEKSDTLKTAINDIDESTVADEVSSEQEQDSISVGHSENAEFHSNDGWSGYDTPKQVDQEAAEVLSKAEKNSDTQSDTILEDKPKLESTSNAVSEDEESVSSSVSNDPHFEAIMSDYYAKKTAVAEAAKRGETIQFEATQTRSSQKNTDQLLAKEETTPEETAEEKYSRSLKKTRTGFAARLNEFFAKFRKVDEEFFEELEEMLILSDVGVTVATQLTDDLRQEARLEKAKKPEELKRVIIEKLVNIYEKDDTYHEAIQFHDGVTVMLFVGVNGVGKTTSIGKLAYKYKKQGKKVMLVAADTFRAGAVAQLVEWGRRVDVPVVTGAEKADPASVVFDGMQRAVKESVDVLMIDTAGRLQNKDNLMKELEKIGRIIKRVIPDAPHETLLALDASTGQNALSQAKEFSKITPLTGIVLTKIDGTAKGGVVLAIRQELDIPVKLIGFGEKIDDIGQFNSENFMLGLLEGLI